MHGHDHFFEGCDYSGNYDHRLSKITISQSMIETKSLPSKLTNSPVVQFWGVLYKRAGEEPQRH